MNTRRSALIACAAAVLVVLGWNQYRLGRQVSELRKQVLLAEATTRQAFEASAQEAEARHRNIMVRLDSAEQNLANAQSALARLEKKLTHLESGSPRMATPKSSRTDPVTQGIEPTRRLEGRRSWGPEQAAGPPDTFQAGDISTAWASREQDAGEEWLKLDYESTVEIAEVRVRETYNPGAVAKITAVLPNGAEAVLWQGTEPPAQAPVEMSFQVSPGTVASAVKVYLDTARVPGWNEIDAVELIGRDGSRQWAIGASASSTYAERLRPREEQLF